MAYSKDVGEKIAAGRFRSSSFMSSITSAMCLWNSISSTRKCIIRMVKIDVVHPGATAHVITDTPGTIRLHRITTDPASTNTATKVTKDSNLTADSGITIYQYNSADGGASGSTVIGNPPANLGGCLAQVFMPRLFTTQRYEMFDSTEMLEKANIVIRPGEGLFVEVSNTNIQQGNQRLICTLEWWSVPTNAEIDADYRLD